MIRFDIVNSARSAGASYGIRLLAGLESKITRAPYRDQYGARCFFGGDYMFHFSCSRHRLHIRLCHFYQIIFYFSEKTYCIFRIFVI